jgi:hypothetical protein
LPTPTADEVKRQIELISMNPPLDRARRRRKLLHYLVEASFAGRVAKEASVAVDVYGKLPDEFDPAIDGLVRVEKRKLSNALVDYYRNEGKNDPVVISIDGYRAVFTYATHYKSAAFDGPDFDAEPRDWEDELPGLPNPVECENHPGCYLLHRSEDSLRLPRPFTRWLWAETEGKIFITYPSERSYIYPRTYDPSITDPEVDEYGQAAGHYSCVGAFSSHVEPNGRVKFGRGFFPKRRFGPDDYRPIETYVVSYAKRDGRRLTCLTIFGQYDWEASLGQSSDES